MDRRILILMFLLTGCATSSQVGRHSDRASVAQKKETATKATAKTSVSSQRTVLSNTLKNTNFEEVQFKVLKDYYYATNFEMLSSKIPVFEREFPQSAHLADLHYMAGHLALTQKRYSEALQFFNLVMNKYPQNPVGRSALYGKALVFRAMNLPDLAKTNFEEVIRKFPKSQEALLARREVQGRIL